MATTAGHSSTKDPIWKKFVMILNCWLTQNLYGPLPCHNIMSEIQDDGHRRTYFNIGPDMKINTIWFFLTRLNWTQGWNDARL
jgi:hypothetical protein